VGHLCLPGGKATIAFNLNFYEENREAEVFSFCARSLGVGWWFLLRQFQVTVAVADGLAASSKRHPVFLQSENLSRCKPVWVGWHGGAQQTSCYTTALWGGSATISPERSGRK